MEFREDVFIKACTERPETTKMMSKVFLPQWLKTAEYQPILKEVYDFTEKYNIPPTFSVLHDKFEKRDKSMYDARFKKVLNQIESATAELADVLDAIDSAKDVAISRSFMNDIVHDPVFQEMNESFDGGAQLDAIRSWMKKFDLQAEDKDLGIRQAIESLIKERGPRTHEDSDRIPCRIEFIDKWCGGGIRPKNLAIVLAPTGHGKSTFLMIVAHNVSSQGKKVLFISNELAMEEMTERFLSRITGQKLDLIMDDPYVDSEALKRHWNMGLDKRLKLLEVNREINTDEIEALIHKLEIRDGWRPDVVVIDFMERMCPTVSGVRRDQSWNWIGYIAKDLVRMAKRNNWLVWTAGQTNRQGYNAQSVQSMEHAQGSVQHLQESALVLAMRQIDNLPLDDKEAVLLEFKPLKMRQSKKPGSSVMVEAKMGNMAITDRVRRIEEWVKNEEDKAGAFPSKKGNMSSK